MNTSEEDLEGARPWWFTHLLYTHSLLLPLVVRYSSSWCAPQAAAKREGCKVSLELFERARKLRNRALFSCLSKTQSCSTLFLFTQTY